MPPHRSVLTLLAALVLTAVLGVVCAVGLSVGLAGPAPADPAAPGPPGDTVVEITGDAANGFDITYYDGTSIHPPTDSEAAAECSEYDTRVARVRCNTEVRVWYREIAVTQQALAWAHSTAG